MFFIHMDDEGTTTDYCLHTWDTLKIWMEETGSVRYSERDPAGPPHLPPTQAFLASHSNVNVRRGQGTDGTVRRP